MRRAALIVGVCSLLTAADAGLGARPTIEPEPPRVGIFYYAWYGTPARDGAWQHWGQGEHVPPASLGSTYYPVRGAYSSADPSIVRAQMREIAAAGIDTVVVSWWGPGSVEDTRLRPVAAAAAAAGLEVALHVEPWAGGTPDGGRRALRSLRELGIRDVYVYDSTREPDEEWRAALASRRDMRVFAHTPMPGKALRGGFHGPLHLRRARHDGNAFGRMCASARGARARLRAVGRPRLRRGPGDGGDARAQAAHGRLRPHVVLRTFRAVPTS